MKTAIINFTIGFTAVSLIVLATAILTLDWFGGCGETFITANGSHVQGECIGRDIATAYIIGVFK